MPERVVAINASLEELYAFDNELVAEMEGLERKRHFGAPPAEIFDGTLLAEDHTSYAIPKEEIPRQIVLDATKALLGDRLTQRVLNVIHRTEEVIHG